MSNESMTPAETESVRPIQFEHAEQANTDEPLSRCGACRQVLSGEYFLVNGIYSCPACAHSAKDVRDQLLKAGGFRRFAKAALWGTGAAIAGTLAYYFILALTDMQFGLLAIAVGFIVGKAVFAASGHVGGRRYQVLAVMLTYLSIVGSYAPFIVKGLVSQEQAKTSTPAAEGKKAPQPETAAPVQPEVTQPDKGRLLASVAILAVYILVLSMIAPFLGGVQNIMGWAIIAFGLFEAYKLNRPIPLVLEGPFHIAPAEPSQSTSATAG